MSQQSFYYENPYSSVQYAPNDPRQVYFNAYSASKTSQQPISYSSAGEAYTQQPPNQQMRGTIQARQPNTDGIRDYMPWSLINILLGGVFLGIIGVLLSYETQNRKNEGDVQSAKKWSRITLIFNVFTDLVVIGIIIAVVVVYTTKNQNIY